MSPKSALPRWYWDIDEFWKGTDNASWLMRMKKRVQYWFAAGPRASGFWKWRLYPKTVFKIGGGGDWRYEDGASVGSISFGGSWLSRIQCWKRWHVALMWPLWFQLSWIFREKDVPEYPNYRSDFGITKMISFGIGWKYDPDRYYIPTAQFGGNFE